MARLPATRRHDALHDARIWAARGRQLATCIVHYAGAPRSVARQSTRPLTQYRALQTRRARGRRDRFLPASVLLPSAALATARRLSASAPHSLTGANADAC